MMWQAAAICVNPDKFEGASDADLRNNKEVFLATNPYENIRKIVKADFGVWVNNPLRGYWRHLAGVIPPTGLISMIDFRKKVRDLGFKGNFALMFRFMVTLDTGTSGFKDMTNSCSRQDLYKLAHALEDQSRIPKHLVVNRTGSEWGPDPYEGSLPREA